jgi:nucleotide-binding universal stress UspA family protein
VAAAQWETLDDELLATERLHEQAREFARGLGVLSRSVIDTATDRMRSVVSTAQKIDCDLIVIAGERHNAAVRLINGSLIPGLVSASPVPVMVCAHRPPHEPAPHADFDRIMILLGDDDSDARPCVQGIDLGRQLAAELHFLHVMPSGLAPVVDVPGLFLGVDDRLTTAIDCQSQRILDWACQLAAEMGLTAHGTSLPAGTPAKHIAHVAKERACMLIVVEHHGGNALTRLLSGSPIPGLITAGELPVLICPTAGHESRSGAA